MLDKNAIRFCSFVVANSSLSCRSLFVVVVVVVAGDGCSLLLVPLYSHFVMFYQQSGNIQDHTHPERSNRKSGFKKNTTYKFMPLRKEIVL